MSPTPSAPKLVVANTILSGCNVLPPILRSCKKHSNPLRTDGFALPNSSTIQMIGLPVWIPSSSLVAYVT